MCNLYSMTKGQDALRKLFRVTEDRAGNLPSLPAIFPDQMAPIVRGEAEGRRVLEMMRWGFPPPPNVGSHPVTNVRNLASPYWRPWLRREARCLVPVTAFCEYTDSRPKIPHWFALAEDRPLFAFAGIWRSWSGTRRGVEGEHRLFAFLTTETNALLRPVHAKAMPVVLCADDWDLWLEGEQADVVALQRPVAEDVLRLVATGSRADPGEAA
jgi:putative SOS response-associated peptidase YedK